jgi:guanylate kinase
MKDRGDSENQINKRIEKDEEEFQGLDSLIDVKFINDENTNIEELTDQIYSYIQECEESYE